MGATPYHGETRYDKNNSLMGYQMGQHIRFKKWPYDTLPVGAYLIFEDVKEGYKCACAAYKWALSNGARFKRKRFKKGYAIKRMA